MFPSLPLIIPIGDSSAAPKIQLETLSQKSRLLDRDKSPAWSQYKKIAQEVIFQECRFTTYVALKYATYTLEPTIRGGCWCHADLPFNEFGVANIDAAD